MPGTFLTLQAFERPTGPVDQLEDRYLGMVEAVGSNPTRSTFPRSEITKLVPARAHLGRTSQRPFRRTDSYGTRNRPHAASRKRPDGPRSPRTTHASRGSFWAATARVAEGDRAPVSRSRKCQHCGTVRSSHQLAPDRFRQADLGLA